MKKYIFKHIMKGSSLREWWGGKMIILKANKELQMVFQKVINTLGKRTDWGNIFLVLDNSLVLYGKNRCLFFSFDKNNNGNDKFLNLSEISLYASSALRSG